MYDAFQLLHDITRGHSSLALWNNFTSPHSCYLNFCVFHMFDELSQGEFLLGKICNYKKWLYEILCRRQAVNVESVGIKGILISVTSRTKIFISVFLDLLVIRNFKTVNTYIALLLILALLSHKFLIPVSRYKKYKTLKKFFRVFFT